MIEAITVTADKHAPKKYICRPKKKNFYKTVDNKIKTLKIKTQQRMFKTHFLSNDISKVDEYRIYSTKLNKFKSQSKTLYCCKHFNLSKNNMNLTRKLIGTLIRCKTKGQSGPKKLIVSN